jgi:phytoene desaturase
VFFPRGGTGALVEALVRVFCELGGELRLSEPVQSIDVVTSEGRTSHHEHSQRGVEPFDLVVSNADLHHTYSRLYAKERSAERTTRRLERMDWSMSLFVLYFGTRRTYPDVAHHTVLFGRRYRELLKDIFEGPELADDFSLYLHAPCATDPGMAPAGHNSFYVLSPVPHLGTAAIDWQRVGPRYAERILEAVERRALPNLRQHLVTQHFITPRDFQSDLVAYQGSAFSVAPTLTQSAWFRPHNQDPDIPGLYIVGAGTHPGAGLPGVINSAKATVRLIQKRSPHRSAA